MLRLNTATLYCFLVGSSVRACVTLGSSLINTDGRESRLMSEDSKSFVECVVRVVARRCFEIGTGSGRLCLSVAYSSIGQLPG